jgi:hypothetical protein
MTIGTVRFTGHTPTWLRRFDLGALADLGFVGLEDDPDDPVIVTGFKASKNNPLTKAQKEANRLLNRERAAVEHGIGDLKNWRVLTRLRLNASCSPTSKSPADRRSTPMISPRHHDVHTRPPPHQPVLPTDTGWHSLNDGLPPAGVALVPWLHSVTCWR